METERTCQKCRHVFRTEKGLFCGLDGYFTGYKQWCGDYSPVFFEGELRRGNSKTMVLTTPEQGIIILSRMMEAVLESWVTGAKIDECGIKLMSRMLKELGKYGNIEVNGYEADAKKIKDEYKKEQEK